MSAPTKTFHAEFFGGIRAELTLSMDGMRCEWISDLPRNLPLADREAGVASYRIWRDECLDTFAAENNLRVVHHRIQGYDVIAFLNKKKPQ